MGRAEDLFLRIKNGGANEIDRMVTETLVEGLFLDYKRAATVAPFARLDPSDSKNFSKAIAGFANSEGDVIVWGVDCRQNPPYGDIPTGISPIANPVAFKTLLDTAVSGRTLPAHSGVENIPLLIAGQSDGFVVTHIPIGMHVPYRTLGAKEEYYIRAGSNFVPTSHAVLASLFGRRPSPDIQILETLDSVKAEEASMYGPPFRPYRHCSLSLGVSLLNHGRGLAEDIFLGLEMEPPPHCEYYFNYNEKHWESWATVKDNRICFTMIAKSYPRLPPGSERTVMRIQLAFKHHETGDVIIDMNCGSGNGPGSSRSITLPAEVMTDAIEHYLANKQDPHIQQQLDRYHENKIKECLGK
jgi:hypothetical protein